MKQRIAGPYKVIPGAGVYSVMRLGEQGALMPLDPPASYGVRQNAYRRARALNLAWQKRERVAQVQEKSLDVTPCL